jgi:hypothetical protein
VKATLLKIIWGMIISCLVFLTLATIQGHVTFDRFLGWKSFTIFTCLSILSFVSYFVSGIKKWGWLFPALIFASLALNSVGLFAAYGSPIVAFPILLSFAVPFYVGYLINRKQWGWLVPAWLLTLIALIPALVPLVNESLLIALILYSLSLPFMVGCLSNPGCKWSLFIAGFFGFLGLFSLVDSFIHGGNLEPVALLVLAVVIISLVTVDALMVTNFILKIKASRQLSS